MITTLQLTNYRCFADVSTRLTPFTVLVGPNGSGKTAFLRALLQLSRVVFIVDDKTGALTENLAADVPLLREKYQGMPIAAGTAIREIEAALFADPDAVERVCPGLRLPKLHRQTPEEIRDPKAAFAKAYAVYATFAATANEAEDRMAIFDGLDLHRLSSQCPRRLGSFVASLEHVIMLFDSH